ncbi:MAG: V-type ATP synthase subunit D [Chlamydiia bacterium]|nr:V-type ATP synthase subunit D [Chlamydiia bacterium]MCH9615379.1 V-type ATP synthase subunit D [Chlamydiia bacterium]MCH9628299.1 V-type ATP synthase subunit D [Chlamydiia bacterium]
MIKLTKMGLRDEQLKLAQLTKYLPTLQLKKAMLQLEVNQVNLEIEELKAKMEEKAKLAEGFAKLLTGRDTTVIFDSIKVKEVKKTFENIAGVDIPIYEGSVFEEIDYPLMTTPVWWDAVITKLRDICEVREEIRCAKEKKIALEKELREVSIRVNLFEKILIPRTEENIRKIKVFLSDQQLSAVAQAKMAKRKIELRKQAHDL